jgi:hypothetical protein
MTIDCVDGETNFGVRVLAAVAAPCAGTVIVKRADAATGADDAVAAGGIVAIGSVTGMLCVVPPLEQLHRPHSASNARVVVRIEFLK